MKQKKKPAGAASLKAESRSRKSEVSKKKKPVPAKTKPPKLTKGRKKIAAKRRKVNREGPVIPATTLAGQHERFCQLHVAGMKATPAYREVFGNVKGADASASRLLSSVKVSARIKELNEAAARGVVMSKQELLEFYTRAIRTPIANVTRNSDLCHKAKYTVIAGKEDEPGALEVTLVEIQTVSKVACGEQLAKLHKWLGDTVELTVADPLGSVMRTIRDRGKVAV